MKYTKTERMEIGRRIDEGELTTHMAAVEYDINFYTARDYAREYKASRSLRTRMEDRQSDIDRCRRRYEKMTREELIDELIHLRFPGVPTEEADD